MGKKNYRNVVYNIFVVCLTFAFYVSFFFLIMKLLFKIGILKCLRGGYCRIPLLSAGGVVKQGDLKFIDFTKHLQPPLQLFLEY